MASTKELPQLVSEFVDMSKAYLRQETVGRAKLLGRQAGLGLAAALVAALAATLLAVAGVRLLIDLMPGEPSHRMWSGLAYILGSVLTVGFGGLIVAVASR